MSPPAFVPLGQLRALLPLPGHRCSGRDRAALASPARISHSSGECRSGSLRPRVPLGRPDPSLGHSSDVSWSPADKPSPSSRQAEDEDDEVAPLVPSGSEWVPSAGTLWGGSGGSGSGDDAGGLHPGRAKHGRSVPLTLPCPGRETPHRALCLGHCALVPDKSPAEPSRHHHHHLPAAVSPQDPLTPAVPIPREPRQPLQGGTGRPGFPWAPVARASPRELLLPLSPP